MRTSSLLAVLPVALLCFSGYHYVDGTALVFELFGLDKSANKETKYVEKEYKSNEKSEVEVQNSKQPPTREHDLTKANWQFSEDITQVLSKSPIFQLIPVVHLQLVLSLFIYGAKDETLCELTNALHYDHVDWKKLSPEEKKYELSLILREINNLIGPVSLGLFVSDECSVSTEFQQFIKKYLTSVDITIDKLDAQEANVDSWINSLFANSVVKFRGGDVKGGSRFVLAIGGQRNFLLPESTRYAVTYEDLFYLPDGQSTYVNYFTTLQSSPVCYEENDNFTAVVRDTGASSSVLMIVPKGTDVGCLSVDISDILKKCTLKMIRRSYPIFNVNKHDDLEIFLSKIGVTSLFCSETANLKGLFDSKEKVYIDDAFVDYRRSFSTTGTNVDNAIIVDNFSYDSVCTSGDKLVILDRPHLVISMQNSNVVAASVSSFGASAY